MTKFRFYTPIDIRFSDLDPQWHVNNSRTVSFLEQARILYFKGLGLWDGKSFLQLGQILADTHISYRKPILFDQKVRVGVCVDRIGNKSLHLAYQVEDAQTGEVLATAETVNIAYDYATQSSLRVPDEWRRRITDFEQGKGS